MGKIYGLHTIELRPGIPPEEFERFATRTLADMPALPGWRFVLLKGERGERTGTYLVLVEIDSVEARERVHPPSGLSDEAQRWYEQAAPILERWRRYTTHVPGLDAPSTDFHELTA